MRQGLDTFVNAKKKKKMKMHDMLDA